MRNKVMLTSLLLILGLTALSAGDVNAERRARTFGSPKPTAKKAAGKEEKLKPFADLIKDRVAIKGLFTFYHDTTDNTMLMEIKPDQIGPLFLCNETRTGSEGAVYDNVSMGNSFPFCFQRVGKRLLMLEKNVRFRADTSSSLHRAVGHGISDHLFASTEVKSQPHDSSKAILVDPAEFFVRDAQNVGYFLGTTMQAGFTFDGTNSFFERVKSFPLNTEIDVRLHYKSSKPFSAATMQSPYSMFHSYHYSLSTLPQTDYVPRIADDRVGHFLTLYQDYTTLDEETPYVRYIERWQLKKKNPEARMSEPVEPIVFWIENTVPPEYRDAVAEGIEFWNRSFEKIGFRNAVVAKQMPDTADWDPADVRFNTVRWMVMPGAAYAVGPSRANPFTGQIYDADIRISSDFIRYMFSHVEYFIRPVSSYGLPDENMPLGSPDAGGFNPRICTYGAESAKEAAFGLSYLMSAAGDLADKDSLTREYVHAYLVELVAHEVGHTLGLRHNFKASIIYNLDQINDPNFTRQHSMIGTVMDYNPPNIAGHGRTQGEFFASVPGPSDDWVIEYAYVDLGARAPNEEMTRLREIASRAPDPLLAYGTDEDAFGASPKSVDPTCNLFDQGDDVLAYCEHKIGLTEELWKNAVAKFEKPGEGYQTVMRAFENGWRSYFESARFAAKFVGGLYHHRNHAGDPGGVTPFQPVPATEQRRAMNFLRDRIFAADAFNLPAELLNRLQPERFPDFEWSVYSMPQIDYPLHEMVLMMQTNALNSLYSQFILRRLVNNLERYAPGDERYTMFDMFAETRKAIWSELDRKEDINDFRRPLQLRHLSTVIGIYLSPQGAYPDDARSLAANDLDILEASARSTEGSTTINGMTRAHLREVMRQIEAAKGARRNYTQVSPTGAPM
ncbi:MAG TPA: zinc-dependent metalloprotease [Candidatus Deferrimicrobium sp.]|nr:zinc-dependent metalloprotease [Candidatus Deferrimicrobium sp.]